MRLRHVVPFVLLFAWQSAPPDSLPGDPLDLRGWFGFRGPSGYLRLGPSNWTRLRAELRTPSATPAVAGWARAGLGYHRGRRRGASAYVGVATVKVAAGDVHLPPPTGTIPTKDRLAGAVSRQPSAVSRQPSAVSRQPSALPS